MEELGFVAIVVADSWHIANDKHFGDVIYAYDSTSRVFNDRMDAIQNAFDVLSDVYKGVKVVSKKGLQSSHDNELSYHGREFHIISFPVYRK